MPRISQLPSLTTADNADEIAIVDVSASTTKKITRGDLLKAPLPTKSVTLPAINGGTTAGVLKTSATGVVQVQELIAFSAYRNGELAISDGATIVFNAETFDAGNNFNTTTGVFTAPLAGYYQFNWFMQTTTATEILSALQTGAGSGVITQRGSWSRGGPYISTEGTALVYLDAGHTARIVIIASQGTTKTISSGPALSYFMGRLVG